MIWRRLSVFLALCGLTVAFGYAATHQHVRMSSYVTPSSVKGEWTAQQDAYWRGRISAVGGTEAYRTFAESTAREPLDWQHPQAHAFSKLLYEEEGLEGSLVCDMQFSMGCLHEFFAQAIATEGIEVLPQLGAFCDTLPDLVNPANCRHGIGHGIQAWFGYEPKRLLEGLAACRQLPHTEGDVYGGCVSGLYMEYNLRVMEETDAPRQVVDGNYFSPCDTVSQGDLGACVFWLPQWWTYLFNDHISSQSNFSSNYVNMGMRCRGFGLAEDVEDDCFRGVANIVASAADSLGSVQAPLIACDAAASNVREKMICRSYLAATYYGERKTYAGDVCDGLDPTSNAYCMAFATGKADYIRMVPLTQQHEI